IGEIADWERGELRRADDVTSAGKEYTLAEGERAFYGPKLEFHFKDAIRRSWQLGTLQIDLGMPQRFGLKYIGEDGEAHTPMMLHRAILGSLERFIGVYTEHTSGHFPLWLAPVQAVIVPIADRHIEYARTVEAQMRA